MHRRARHLTGRAAGASFHFDARWLSFSDGNSVGTITDLAGTNNLTQATTADQAIYKVNILNGNPVLRFDGATDFYSLASTVPITGEYFAITLFKNTNTYSPTFANRTSASGTPYTNFMYGNTIYSSYLNGAMRTSSVTTNLFQAITTYTDSSYSIRQFYSNGSPLSGMGYDAGTETGSLDTFGRRDWDNPDTFFGGDFAAGIHLRGSLAGSLRKRFEHAMGFSFKISCS